MSNETLEWLESLPRIIMRPEGDPVGNTMIGQTAYWIAEKFSSGAQNYHEIRPETYRNWFTLCRFINSTEPGMDTLPSVERGDDTQSLADKLNYWFYNVRDKDGIYIVMQVAGFKGMNNLTWRIL